MLMCSDETVMCIEEEARSNVLCLCDQALWANAYCQDRTATTLCVLAQVENIVHASLVSITLVSGVQ